MHRLQVCTDFRLCMHQRCNFKNGQNFQKQAFCCWYLGLKAVRYLLWIKSILIQGRGVGGSLYSLLFQAGNYGALVEGAIHNPALVYIKQGPIQRFARFKG